MSFMICCVGDCLVRLAEGGILHRFPNPNTDQERFQAWITKIGGEVATLKHDYVYKNKRICHKHFQAIYYGLKNRLIKTAVPILHLPGSTAINSRTSIDNGTDMQKDNIDQTSMQREDVPQTSIDNIEETDNMQEENVDYTATECEDVPHRIEIGTDFIQNGNIVEEEPMETVEDVKACRVCLATNVKLYDMYKYKLNNVFEVISGIQVSPADRYPQYLCAYCSIMLIKCATFREKCRSSKKLMKHAGIKDKFLTTSEIDSLAVSNDTLLPYSTIPPSIISISYTKTDHDNDVVYKEEVLDESDEEPLANKVKEKELNDDYEDPGTQDDMEINYLDENTGVFQQESNVDLPMNDIEVIYLSKEEQLQELLARKESHNYIHSFYKCSLCYKGFLLDGTYRNHMLRHDPEYGEETCEICQTRWPDIRSLKSHATAAHEKKFICKLCDHVSKSSHRAKEHLQWHKGHKFICKICGASFSKSTSHLTHLRLQHPTKFCCGICGESFLGEIGLNMHVKKSHRGFEQLNVKLEFKCGVCSVLFKSMEALNRHTSGFENEQCDKSMSSCFQCGENVLTRELLRDHMKTHEVGVRCDECNRNFANERSFSIHYQRVHLGIKLKYYKPKNKRKRVVWVCEMCGKKCVSNAALVYHQRTHTGEKPYQCEECPKKFSVYQRLKIHVRTHTGERPFKCSSCPKAFKHKAALNRHDRVHSGAKPYQCGHCGKTFSQSNSMKLHVRTVHLKMPAPYRTRRDKNTVCELLDHDQ